MKRFTTMIFVGIFCLALFIPAGCSINSGDVELTIAALR